MPTDAWASWSTGLNVMSEWIISGCQSTGYTKQSTNCLCCARPCLQVISKWQITPRNSSSFSSQSIRFRANPVAYWSGALRVRDAPRSHSTRVFLPLRCISICHVKAQWGGRSFPVDELTTWAWLSFRTRPVMQHARPARGCAKCVGCTLFYTAVQTYQWGSTS